MSLKPRNDSRPEKLAKKGPLWYVASWFNVEYHHSLQEVASRGFVPSRQDPLPPISADLYQYVQQR